MVYYFVTELAGFTIYIATTREVEEEGFLSAEIEDFHELVDRALSEKGRNLRVLWL